MFPQLNSFVRHEMFWNYYSNFRWGGAGFVYIKHIHRSLNFKVSYLEYKSKFNYTRLCFNLVAVVCLELLRTCLAFYVSKLLLFENPAMSLEFRTCEFAYYKSVVENIGIDITFLFAVITFNFEESSRVLHSPPSEMYTCLV